MSVHLQRAGSDFERWPEVLALLRSSFAYMAARIDPPSSMNRLDLAGLRDKAGLEICLLAVDGDQILGCAFLNAQSDSLYVGKVAVDQSARGRGIARMLFNEAEHIARQRSLPFLELQTRVELVENHRTFERLGFRKSGEDSHPGYDRPTSIRMRKPVNPVIQDARK